MKDLDFTKEYVLENERALLKPLERSDINLLLPFSIHEPELWRYSLRSADGEENLKNYIDFAIESKESKTAYPFLVIDKQKNKVAGTTRFYDIQKYHNTTQLGFTWYGNDFQGTGLNKNCKYLLLSFAFDRMNVERVEFRADALNARSIAAMKSIGCVKEGVLRSNCTSPSGRRDSIILSILKNEWENHAKKELLQKIGHESQT